MACIYLINWDKNEYFYIGQTQNMKLRKGEHANSLRIQKHFNKRLQNVFNKYGEPQFHIIEECSIEELDEREQFYLDLLFNDPNCLNLAKYASAPMRGRKHSEKTKKMMSEAKKGEKHPSFGSKHTDSVKKQISKSRSKPVVQMTLGGEEIKIWVSMIEVERVLGLSNAGISKCCKGKRLTCGGWKWSYYE